MKLIQSIYLPTAIFALLFTSACGDSSSTSAVSAAKTAAVNLDGSYKFKSQSCSTGQLSDSAQGQAQILSGSTLTIQGTSLNVAINISATCVETDSATLSSITSTSLSSLSGAITCSKTCITDGDSAECFPQAAANIKSAEGISLANGVFTVTDTVHSDSICADGKGVLVQVWSK